MAAVSISISKTLQATISGGFASGHMAAVATSAVVGEAARYCIAAGHTEGTSPTALTSGELNAALRLLCICLAAKGTVIADTGIGAAQLTSAILRIFCNDVDAAEAAKLTLTLMPPAEEVFSTIEHVNQLLSLRSVETAYTEAYCRRIGAAGATTGSFSTASAALNVLVQLMRQEGREKQVWTTITSDASFMDRFRQLSVSEEKSQQGPRLLVLWLLVYMVGDSSAVALSAGLRRELLQIAIVAICDADAGIAVMASCIISLIARNCVGLREVILRSDEVKKSLLAMLHAESGGIVQSAAIFTSSVLFIGIEKDRQFEYGAAFDAIGYQIMCVIACPTTTLEVASLGARALHGIAYNSGNASSASDYACLLPALMTLARHSMCTRDTQAAENFVRLMGFLYSVMNPTMLSWTTATEIGVIVDMLREGGSVGTTAARIVLTLYGISDARVTDMLDYHGVPGICFDAVKHQFLRGEDCDPAALRRACGTLACLMRPSRVGDVCPAQRIQAMVSLGAPSLLVAIAKAPGSKLATFAHATRKFALSGLASILHLQQGSLDEFLDDSEFIDVLHQMVLSDGSKTGRFSTRVRWLLQQLAGVRRDECRRGQDAMLSLLTVKPLFEHPCDECAICRGNNADTEEGVRALGVVHCAHCNVQVHSMCIRVWVHSRTPAADACTNCQRSFTGNISALWNGTVDDEKLHQCIRG